MSADHCATPIAFVDVMDYWSGDLTADAEARIEEHVFTCSDCARALAEAEAVSRAVAAAVRSGRFHAIVSESVLNRLARDGVHVRTYTLTPGQIVPCAVWADDEVVVSRLRADFTGYDSLSVVASLASGDEIARTEHIVPRPGQTEIIDAISADWLRHLPATTIRLTVSGRTGATERAIGEYMLQHAGALSAPLG